MGGFFGQAPQVFSLASTDRVVAVLEGAGPNQTGNRVFMVGALSGSSTHLIDDLILIGNNARSSGTELSPVTDTNLNGTVVIGSQAAKKLANTNFASRGPNVVIGFNAMAAAVNANSNVIIGDSAASAIGATGAGSLYANVIIGSHAFKNPNFGPGTGVTLGNNVVIGNLSARGSVSGNGGTCQQNVIIGDSAMLNWGASQLGQPSQSVVIGFGAAPNYGGSRSTNGTVIIGSGAGLSMNVNSNCIVIGGDIIDGTAANNCDNNIILGTGAGPRMFQSNIMIGVNACAGVSMGSDNIIFGFNAGQSMPVTNFGLCMESIEAGVRRSFMYGNSAAGNMLLGNTTNAHRGLVDSPTTAVNTQGIAQGAPSAINPPAGTGYWYYTETAAIKGLHFVSSAGTDTLVAPL